MNNSKEDKLLLGSCLHSRMANPGNEVHLMACELTAVYHMTVSPSGGALRSYVVDVDVFYLFSNLNQLKDSIIFKRG